MTRRDWMHYWSIVIAIVCITFIASITIVWAGYQCKVPYVPKGSKVLILSQSQNPMTLSLGSLALDGKAYGPNYYQVQPWAMMEVDPDTMMPVKADKWLWGWSVADFKMILLIDGLPLTYNAEVYE